MSAPVPPPPTLPSVELRLRSLRDTARLGRALARVLTAGELLLLEGSLGAGKTCLVRFIVRALGVPADQPVTSPTFEILHEFRGHIPIVHADLYRLDPSEPLEELGLLDRIGGDAVVLIEWGERFAAQLGDAGILLTLALGPAAERHCTLSARGENGRELLERLIPLLSAARLTPF
ncbi:MAG: tRNA (adenosine(37)-N6)-threonylcarbamoyltransferase complex ATPase subunit type 1 TsaE [Polyangiales bacterium]